MMAAAPILFISLVCLGGLYVAAVLCRLVAYLAAFWLLRPKQHLRSSYDGQWAIVAGAASGPGRSMALELARGGLNLVPLDLNAANLRETSDTIRSSYDVQTKTVGVRPLAFGTTQGEEVMGRLREAIQGLDVGLLVNNAAVGTSASGALYFHEADVERYVRMHTALTEVMAAVLPGLLERRRAGAVVSVGSCSTSMRCLSLPATERLHVMKTRNTLGPFLVVAAEGED